MLVYAIRRTLQAIPLLILISIILFSILHAMPGGGLAAYTQNPHLTQADIERLKHNLGLDQPIFPGCWPSGVKLPRIEFGPRSSPIRKIEIPPQHITWQCGARSQYGGWVWALLHGDLGWSQLNSTPVTEALLERLPATLELTITAFVLSLAVGLLFGIIAAVRPYSPVDYFVTTFAFFGQSMPVFWFAIMLQMAFAVFGLHAQGFGYRFDFTLPSAGMTSTEGGDFIDRVRHLVLPVTVLGLLQIATWSRFTRASMQEVLHTDYMRTAAAKGLPFLTILIKHGLKNALMPVVTIVALSLPGIVAGAIITETIFAWPGMGRLFITALGQQDLLLMMGYLVIISIFVVFSNLLADLSYGWLDPRVRYS